MAHTNDNIDTYDYIIIGGGTSGAVAARRLAEGNTNLSVCLLEAGPSDAEIVDGRMIGRWALNGAKSPDWNYDTIAQKGCNNRIIHALRARYLGGCSAVNGTLLIRGAKADYDRIAALGNPGWSWEEMLPYFKASETFHPVEWHQADLNAHGNSGPLHTEPHRLAAISEKVLDSFIDSGFEYKPDMFVQGDYEGVGHVVRTAHKGIRSTSADFVHSYGKTNLTVQTGVYVDRFILEKNDVNDKNRCDYKAVGVEAHYDGNDQSIIIKARKEIILSAGAYNSPMILMHSGIGPAEHLIEMGISCKVDLPGVGGNLQDHTIVYTSYQVNDPSLTVDRFYYNHPELLTESAKQWHETKTGPLADLPVGAFALKRIDKTIQDPVWEAAKSEKQTDQSAECDPTGQWLNQPHIEFWTSEMQFFAPNFIEGGELPPFPVEGEGVITLITFLCASQSRGTVRLSSKNPSSAPIIDHAYLENDLDVAVLAEGCRIGHEVLTKGRGTKDVIVGPWPKTASYANDLASWKEHVRAFANTCYHPGGTCKMAPDTDPMGVVDHRLRVRNIEGLRVADVSIMPLLNNGHTQAPAYAIGEKVAHMVLEDATLAN
ncbi:unnamed protein product [Rotaria magnacalcarata]|uniref:Glucose-methanol-choline oxidoreductase N-terminal domain-containing protein n=2 Tax=Rotaria magnacalcarata TaxID=392030 RepID=A0A816V9B7_9BILA|nr:unnamed protein product [Rotaria magnacalcarata]CAF4042650.1 unnamed protein product [Rotaria magnacalcarata]